MKKRFFLYLLLLTMAWTYQVRAQDFAATNDSLVATFEIKNKKAVAVQPNTVTAKAAAQRNTTDLLLILDKFFSTDQYRNAKSVKTIQYFINADLSNKGMIADSFQSVVYILNIPGAVFFNKYLKADTFLRVVSRPTKVPEKFYISCLDFNRIMLVSVLSPQYRDAAAAAQRQKNINAYLVWLQHKYR